MANNSNIFQVKSDEFQQLVVEKSQQMPVVVDFWADWCAPCKQLMPVLEKLAVSEGFALAKINADEEQALVGQFGVRSLPTVKLVINGQVVDEFSGVLTESQVRGFLEKHIVSPLKVYLEDAEALCRQGEWQQALELLREANQKDPDNYEVLLQIADIQLKSGNQEEVSEILAALPVEARDTAVCKQLTARLRFADQAAKLLPLKDLESRLIQDPDNGEVLCQIGLHHILDENFEDGTEALFAALQKGGSYDSARKILIELFDMLGAAHPLVRQYRRRLYTLLH